MTLSIYQVDAFAQNPFEGNPAAVIPLDDWLPDETMQAIAEENNLSETAFFVSTAEGLSIRWFTPTTEVRLCGHATLASAFVLFTQLHYPGETLTFQSLSGPLSVSRHEDLLTLNFPVQMPAPCRLPDLLVKGLGKKPLACLKHTDIIAVFENENDIKSLTTNDSFLKQLDCRGIIATAPSSAYDFIARFFAPACGISEDPVTGSAYTQLVPYWSQRLQKNNLTAKQVSKRGGQLRCQLQDGRVLISGCARLYMTGTIDI